MTSRKTLLFFVVYTFKHVAVAQGSEPGHLSRFMCEEYSKYAPDEGDCPFNQERLIHGNIIAEEGEFPHMVSLGYQSDESNETSWSCRGSLISDQYVLTVAHCLRSPSGPPVAVRLGVTNFQETEHQQEIKISEVIAHPEFRSPELYNDIGLVKLENKVNISFYARPACLFTERDIGQNRVIESGWSRPNFGEFDNRLQKLELELYDQESCNKSYNKLSSSRRLKNGITYDTMVCAGTKSRHDFGSISGDPLQIFHDGLPPAFRSTSCMYDIIGVSCFGYTLVGNQPNVYTRVSPYIKWIEDNVWK